jgi:hypothetical protein
VLSLRECLESELNDAECKAWDSLARYKFQMFGYWSAIWVHLNRVGGFKRANPWRSLVDTARRRMGRENDAASVGHKKGLCPTGHPLRIMGVDDAHVGPTAASAGDNVSRTFSAQAATLPLNTVRIAAQGGGK